MTTTLKPKPQDRAALTVTLLFGVGAAIWTLVQAVLRIVEIAPNRNVPVTASFADADLTLPLGPDGAQVPVVAEQVVLFVSDMPAITVVSLILAEVVYALTVIIAIACGCLIIRNLIAGRAFDTRTVGLMGTLALTIAIGWAAGLLFTTMGANGGASALSGGTVENTPSGFEPVMLFVIASLGALSFAFTAGGRLQRETEGLV